MAQNPACQNDDGNPAMFIGTNLDTGSTVTLCPSCLLQFCGVIVEGMTGMPVNELIAEMATSSDEPAETITDPDSMSSPVMDSPSEDTGTEHDADAEHSATDAN